MVWFPEERRNNLWRATHADRARKCHNLLLGLGHPGCSTLITWLLSVWRARCVLQMSNDATLCDRAGVCCGFHRPSERSIGIKIACWTRVAWHWSAPRCVCAFSESVCPVMAVSFKVSLLSVPSGSFGSSPLEDADPAVPIWQLQIAPAGKQLCLHYHPTGWFVCH